MKVHGQLLENLKVKIQADGHELLADEPREAGGHDAGPNPYGLLLSSLAACKVITAQMYARRKEWPLTGISVGLNTHKVHAKDCEECDSDPDAKVDIIDVEIAFEGDLDEQQRQRLAEIADRCPVHRTLTSETKIRTQRVESIGN